MTATPPPAVLRPPVRLVLDWDGTVTYKDTLHFLGRICASHQKQTQQAQAVAPPPPAQPPSTNTAAWDAIVAAYLHDYSAHAAHYHPPPHQRTRPADESAWLASLQPIEARSAARVTAARLFAGVTAADVRAGAAQAIDSEELRLRPGWADLFASNGRRGTSSPGITTSILSVNWSASFVRACLLRAAEKKAAVATEERSSADLIEAKSPAAVDAQALQRALQGLRINANEIAGLDQPSGSSGQLDGAIRTSADKRAHIDALRARVATGEEGGDGDTIVYVGDSATDFDALLAADVGVCVRDEPMGGGQRELAEAMERVGVPVRRLGEATGELGKGAQGEDEEGGDEAAAAAAGDREARQRQRQRGVWWVRDLREVAEYIGQVRGARQ
ncbi:uncharacterized protein K452DRAFT_318505 [Aplosporella prunicola CBS 121167]|uniref:Uncharacterized protein n=1 Tax=Aplosporella prunicola CBS 121167 TaxID=1176127 RepID=A0A6A6BFP4_9PEZI|nr:uncharacterized protein K452DRAFT_318505 [Aplosporella prunicola CBS 121167]KAF2142223.1 hypothetical protein K452DRAFT_318505 [Aplosporella prunicola CBS 121167]